jgi:hypothetical protein
VLGVLGDLGYVRAFDAAKGAHADRGEGDSRRGPSPRACSTADAARGRRLLGDSAIARRFRGGGMPRRPRGGATGASGRCRTVRRAETPPRGACRGQAGELDAGRTGGAENVLRGGWPGDSCGWRLLDMLARSRTWPRTAADVVRRPRRGEPSCAYGD